MLNYSKLPRLLSHHRSKELKQDQLTTLHEGDDLEKVSYNYTKLILYNPILNQNYN